MIIDLPRFVAAERIYWDELALLLARLETSPEARLALPLDFGQRKARLGFGLETGQQGGEFVPINALGGDEPGKVDDHSNCLRFTSRYSAVT